MLVIEEEECSFVTINFFFNLLVMDEADRILNMDFETEVTKILRCIPSERRSVSELYKNALMDNEY